MRTLPPAAVRRRTVRDMLIKHLSAGEDINTASEECMVRATAKLAHIAYRKVRAKHVQWLYPMFGAVDEENYPGEIWFASSAPTTSSTTWEVFPIGSAWASVATR